MHRYYLEGQGDLVSGLIMGIHEFIMNYSLNS